MKKIYEKPSVMVVKLKYQTNLLVQNSPSEKPEEAPEYDGYLQ
jgi:hypothetical protein